MKKAQFVNLAHPVKIGKGKEKSVFVWLADADTVAVDIYEKKDLRYRYVIDVNSGENHVYDYSAHKWTEQKIGTVLNGQRSYYYDYCSVEKVKNVADLKMDKEAEHALKGHWTNDTFRKIENMESEYSRRGRLDAESRRQLRIRELMGKVPPVPADFKEWFFRASGLDELNYLIYDEESERYKCTNCGKKIPENRAGGIRNLRKTICPVCGTEVTPRRNRNQLTITVDGHATLIQKMDENTVVARYIDLEAVYDKNGRHLTMSEAQRMFYTWKWKDLGKEYKQRLYNAQYLRTETRGLYEIETNFDWKSNPCGRICFDSFLYPSDFLADLKGSELENHAYMLRALAESHTCVNVGRLLTCTRYDDSRKTVELAARLGFRQIIRESFADRHWWMDISHDLYAPNKEIINHLMRLPKQDRNRLRIIDGGYIAYDWLMYARKNHTHISDEVLRFVDETRIETDDLEKLPVAASAERLMNYITRQQAESYPGKDAKTVYSQWIDYLQMEEKLEKNLEDEMILWPRELKKRHTEAVEECRAREAALRAKENLELAKKREAEINAKFPKAAAVLEKIRERFAFEDDDYLIRVPNGLYEISQEGYALHHCVGSSDRYFERMDREETYICFLRRKKAPEAPFYTIEVEPGGTIRQHRGMFDEEPELNKVKPFLKKWQQHIHKQLTAKDRELAELSRAGREKSLQERLLIGGKTDRVYRGLMEDLMEISEALAM